MCRLRYRILEKPATNILSNVSKEKRCHAAKSAETLSPTLNRVRPRAEQTNKRKQTNTNKHTSRYGPVGPNRENRRFRRKRYYSAALQQRSVSHCT